MNFRIVLSLAVAVLMAAPAFAAVQNVKVSGSIISTYLNRQEFNLGKPGATYDQSVFLTQTLLRVDADLSDNVATQIGLINERAWGGEGGTFAAQDSTLAHLFLANVTLREFLYSPLTLTVGRQVFAFGNSFIFDATGTNNAATGPLGTIAQDLTLRSSFDAIRATFDYKPLTIDLFWGKSSQGNVRGGNNSGATGIDKDDTDVWGVNTNYQLGDAMNTVAEAYVFGRTTGEGSISTTGGTDRADKLWIPGLRVSTNPIKGLNVQAEAALQRGSLRTTSNVVQERQAYALQGLVSYALPVAELEKYKPTLSGSYTHLSGDKSPTLATNRKTAAWDPFFENQGGGTVYNTLFNLTNLRIVNATLSASPLADVTTSLSWNGLWAHSSYTAGTSGIATNSTLVQPDGTTILPIMSSNKHLGHEFDGNIVYQYTEDVKLGLTVGWFVPGRAFVDSKEAAKQAIASVGVNF